MNSEAKTDTTRPAAAMCGNVPVTWQRCRQIIMAVALVVSSTLSAFANGGDLLANFPVSDPLTAKQEAKAMAVDSVGNIIIVGYTTNGGMNNDYQVTKFNADGSGVAWRATFDKAGGDDQATAVAVDSSNNIIVTGTVWNGANVDIHTIKYGPNGGTPLWQHTWSGPAGADIATAIAVDSADNIYVAGYTVNTSGNDDYLILKYPSSGTVPVWQEIYNASYNNNDRITAIAAGIDGIVVTGASSKGGTDFDILTRKYGFDQSLIWEQRKASAGGGDDRGVAVTMDPAGNVFMAGYLYNGANNDMYTGKYAAASGAPLWEKTSAGAGNDEPRAIWVDGTADVYVTGHTYTYAGNEDFYTVRYQGTDGTKIWEAIYNSGSDYTDIPIGIVGKSGVVGDLFVVGYTTTTDNENITVLKYRKESGALLWQRSFNGVANKNERPVGIGLTVAGDVCVAGWTDTAANSFDYLALKYDFGPLNPPTELTAMATANTAISLAWHDNATNESGFKIERKLGVSGTYSQIATVGANVVTYSDTGLVANSYYYYRVRSYNVANGDSYSSNDAHALTKVVSYDPPSWVYQYNGADNREDEAVGIITGSDDHPIVTGFSDLTEAGVADAYSFDYMTIKLDRADKSVKWQAIYDSGDGGTDMAAGIVLDNEGNVVVTGTAFLMGQGDKSDDLYTIKYNSATHTDPNSAPLVAWGEQYGTQSGIDQATAIQAVKDSANSVVVIGHGNNLANNEDMFILKYLADGTTAWPPIVFDGGNGGNDYPSAVALDAVGNIFITGSVENAAGNFDIYTAKYNGATGARSWFQLYAGAGNGDDHGLSLVVDKKGDAYITGYAVNAAGNEEWVTIKYAGADSAPQRELWRATYNGPAAPVNGNDRGITVALDPIDGALVVAGTAYISATDSDFHFIRYNAADGTVILERNFDRPTTYDYLTAMAIDSSGYIYLTGNSRSGSDTDPAYDASADILSLIYDFEGTFLGATTYNGGLQDEARSIAVNYQGESFAAGVTHNASNPDYLVLKQKNSYILVPAPLQPLSQADSAKINVTWRNNTPGTSFRIERTPGPVLPTSNWTLRTTAAPGTTSFLDTGLSAGTSYCYRIYAYSGSLNSRTIENCATTTLTATTLSPLTIDSSSQITLSWSQLSGNTGYKIERKIGTGAWADLIVKAAGITTHTDAGLTPGTTYAYRITTISAFGYSLPSNELSALTLPAAPSMGAQGAITVNSVVLNWTDVSGETGYRIERKVGAGGVWGEVATRAADVLTFTDTGLTANTQYYYRVRAYNPSGTSVYSGEQGALTLFPATTLASATGSATTQVDLVWADVPGETGYTIQESVCSYNGNNDYDIAYCIEAYEWAWGGWSNVTTVGADILSYARTGRASGYAYRYRIVANTAGNSSAPSNAIIAWTYMTAPVLAITPASETSLTVNWTNILAATNYTLERKIGSGGTWADLASAVGMSAATSATTDTGLALSTEYCYRVKAYSTLPNSPPAVYSNAPCLFTPLAAPVLNAPTGVTASKVDLSWSNVAGNTGYEVQRCNFYDLQNPQKASNSSYLINDANWNSCSTATLAANTLTYQSTGLAEGYTYRYRVRDSYSGGYSAWSTAQAVTTVPPTPTLNVPTAASTTQLNLSFSNNYGETSFSLEWKPRSGADCTAGSWNTPITITQNVVDYYHTGLNPGTYYCYRLSAVNSTGNSGYSAERSQTTLAVAPFLNQLSGVTSGQVVLTWNNVVSNTGYKIERKIGAAGSWATIYTTAADVVSYTNTGLTAGSIYFYRVSTNNASGTSVTSNEQSTTTTPIAPIVSTSTLSANQIDLYWPVVVGATNYKIERKLAAGVYGEIANSAVTYSESYCGYSYPTISCPALSPATTRYQNTALLENTTYCFQLKAWNSTGGDSLYSVEKCATTLPITNPTLTVTPLNAFKIQLNWVQQTCTPNPCDPPDGYEIERLVRDGNWVKIATTVGPAVTTFTDRIAIDPIKQYRYRIRSYRGAVKSPYSAEAVTYTPPYTPGDNVGP